MTTSEPGEPFEYDKDDTENAPLWVLDEHESGAHDDEQQKYAAIYCAFCERILQDRAEAWLDREKEER